MREIKFRYVFKHTKDGDIITEVFSLEKIEKYPLKNYQSIENYLAKDGYVCIDKLQYICLKDKNGVEIYEGDIVIAPYMNGEPCKVIYSDELAKFTMSSRFNFIAIVANLEVIGNIYENQ